VVKACQHTRGEYSDDYQRCTDCGREVVLINGAWFEVEAWIRIAPEFFDEPTTKEQT
jgi:hypothetical protein